MAGRLSTWLADEYAAELWPACEQPSHEDLRATHVVSFVCDSCGLVSNLACPGCRDGVQGFKPGSTTHVACGFRVRLVSVVTL